MISAFVQSIITPQVVAVLALVGATVFLLVLVYMLLLIAFAIYLVILYWHLNSFIKRFRLNAHAPAVIILGYPIWSKLKAFGKLNFTVLELKPIIEYLKLGGRDFAIYPRASREDIEEIMSDKSVKEVYFCGHGDSHSFLLNTGLVLNYCDFPDRTRYEKEFAHQVHCGTKHGKALIEFIVPQENWDKCFWPRKKIFFWHIRRWFGKRIKTMKRARNRKLT